MCRVVGLLHCFTSYCILCTSYAMQDELYHSSKGSSVIGLLDIYGFEVLQHNRYEFKSISLVLFTFKPDSLFVVVSNA